MSLLAWYPLISDGKNQGLDGIDLTTVGNVTYTDGKIGKAATFPANAGVRFRRAAFSAQTNWSVAAWVKCSAATSASQWAFNNGRDSNNDGWHCYFNPAGTMLYLRVGSTMWSKATTLGTWYHVAMTVDKDSKYTFYVDGVQVGTGTVATLPDYSEVNNLMAIGGFYYNGGDIYPLNGQVQDFRYYDHVLSHREVKELSKGLCLHVPLDWGANPNMVKNSYTFMNKNAGASNQWNNSGLTYASSSVIEDDTAPTKWVLKRVITNAKEANVGGAGCFYGIGSKGLAAADLTENEYYTWSFWAKSDSGIPDGLWAGAVVESQTHVSNTGFGALDSNWRKHTVTFKFTKTDRLTNCFYVTVPASSTVDFQVCGLKLEKGQVATPYIRHVEEAAYTASGYASLVKEECSGFKKNTAILSAPINGGASPKGCTCTYFDGIDDAIQIDEAAMPKIISDKFTIAFWIKPDGENGARSVYFGSNGNVAYTINIEKNTSNQLRFYWNGNPDYNNTSFTITDGSWQHIAVVRESATSTKFYKNGVLVNTYTSSCAAQASGSAVYYIGRDQRTGATAYKGYMSDFRLYATALSADDIKALYNIGAEIDNSGKVYCNNLVEV